MGVCMLLGLKPILNPRKSDIRYEYEARDKNGEQNGV